MLTKRQGSPPQEGKAQQEAKTPRGLLIEKRETAEDGNQLLVNRYKYRHSLKCIQCFNPKLKKSRRNESGLFSFFILLLCFVVLYAFDCHPCCCSPPCLIEVFRASLFDCLFCFLYFASQLPGGIKILTQRRHFRV